MFGNMKVQKIVYLSALLLVFSCTSLKKSMITTSENLHETAIHNAILDFSTNCNLFKKASIFSVNFNDSVFNVAILEQVGGRNYKDGRTHEWKRGSLYEGIASVSILAYRICEFCGDCCDKFLYTTKTTVGSKGKLPSRYIEKDGKLFFWWDNDYPLTEEMLAILWKYNLLCDDTEGFIGFPDHTTDDSQKSADYYFCKSDLSKYKRVITNVGLGYYKPPKLKCN